VKFLKIHNRGAPSRRVFELIGYTTKRDADAETVGVKGSGSKFAAIAAVRRGIRLWVTSVDEKGSYAVGYSSTEEMVQGRRVHTLVYDYGSSRISVPVLIDAFPHWDTPIGDDDNELFPILREFIANAHDADREFSVEVVEAPSPQYVAAGSGETIVYIGNQPEFEKIRNTPERYFKFWYKNSEPLFRVPGVGDIYRKSEKNFTRIFVRGVLRDCQEVSSAYDYSLQDRSLVAEEGYLKNDIAVRRHLLALFSAVTDVKIAKEILRSALMEAYPSPLEAAAFAEVREEDKTLLPEVAAAFKTAWEKLNGTNAFFAADTKILELAQAKGATVIFVSREGVRKWLARCGILDAAEYFVAASLARFEDIPFERLSAEHQDFARRIRAVLLEHFPDAAEIPLRYHKTKDGSSCASINYGHSGGDAERFKIISINVATFAASEAFYESLRVAIHEYTHCLTQKFDTDFSFWRQFEAALARTIVRVERLDPVTGAALPIE
jgi:hypothetical protein